MREPMYLILYKINKKFINMQITKILNILYE